MSDMPPGPPPFMDNSSGGPPPMGGGSFAQSMGAFGKMLEIQENISEKIPQSKVPWNETRKMLKAYSIEAIRSSSLYKFHMKLFMDIGLGNMQMVSYAPMHYIYAVPNCPVCNMYPALNNQKVCVATTDALHRFFTEALELDCIVEEIECVKDGDGMCKFKVDLQPISAYQIILDENDRLILSGRRPPNIDDTELRERVKVLTIYKLLENGKLSDIGKTYMQYAANLPIKEKIFDPPWKLAEEMAATAKKAGAFGAAFGELTTKGQSASQPNTTSSKDDSQKKDKTVSSKVKEEAGKSESFAELMAKMKKK
ncbi:MAG: hypothetical protein K8R64_02305 [Methanosarcinaceae archaeon]|nr:hypothetical protein [Methanosarcinaceae archaeon]